MRTEDFYFEHSEHSSRLRFPQTPSLIFHLLMKLLKFLTNLNVNKSTGLDNIGPKILKLAANVLTPSLTFIVNKGILSSESLSYWFIFRYFVKRCT